MADPIAVANAFVTHYNSLFDSPDRTSLAPLYVSLPPAAQLKYHWSSRTLRGHTERADRANAHAADSFECCARGHSKTRRC
jgi:hypothetical protein